MGCITIGLPELARAWHSDDPWLAWLGGDTEENREFMRQLRARAPESFKEFSARIKATYSQKEAK
jgi:hypothetical protein